MFCPNCGTKALDNAEFCQSCGAKLIVGAEEKKQPETSAWQTQAQPGQYPINAPKKKGKKWPIVLGVVGAVLFLLIVLVMIGGSDSSKNQSQENSTGVNLSETDTNEEKSTETSITDDATLGSDLLQGYRILVGETQTIEDEYNGSFEVTLDYIGLADVWQGEDLLVGAYTQYPEQDNIFLCAGVTIKNIGKKEGTVLTAWNTLLYDGAYEFRQSYQEGNDVNIPPLSPPETAVYAFQIPISAVESDKSLVLNIGNGGGSDGKGLFFVLREGADGSVSMPGNAGAGQEETLEEDYTDYLLWCGEYADGWMDTYLTFELYSDGTQNPECGYITTNFRGNEITGKLYYLGGNEFQWEQEGYSPTTYYIYTIENEAGYQLDFYNSDGEYEVTFTQYQQYIS